MNYFGVLTYGFGLLGSAIFVIWGILRIASPDKATAFDRFLMGNKRFSRSREKYAHVNRGSWAVVGVLQIAFGLFFAFALLRSFIYAR
jgi:hypothetical protein